MSESQFQTLMATIKRLDQRLRRVELTVATIGGGLALMAFAITNHMIRFPS